VRHLASDSYQHARFANCGLQLLEEAGARDLVEYVDGLSEIVLPELWRQELTFDLAFVDSNHRFEAVFIDLFYLLAKLRLKLTSSPERRVQVTATRHSCKACYRLDLRS
jgi:hypothetical protein